MSDWNVTFPNCITSSNHCGAALCFCYLKLSFNEIFLKAKTLLNCIKSISLCAFEVMNNGYLNWMVDPSDRMNHISDCSLCKWVVTTKPFCKYLFLFMSQESITYWCMWILAPFVVNVDVTVQCDPCFHGGKYMSNCSYDRDVPLYILPLFDVNIQSSCVQRRVVSLM